MSWERAEQCPTCREPWAAWRSTSWVRLLGDDKRSATENVVVCAEGHEFMLARWATPSAPVIARPESVRTTATVVRATAERCVCGRAIDPGQAYVGESDRPRHLGCAA